MTTIAFLVNGDYHSAIGYRARAFQQQLGERYDIRTAYRSGSKILSVFRFILFLAKVKPSLTYVFDMSYSGVLAALSYKWIAGNALIIDTGDAIYELAKSTGNRGRFGLWLTQKLENASLSGADLIVVRGTFHQRWLSDRGIRAEVIRDGVETGMFAPAKADDLRKQFRLDKILTLGILGSLVWSERLQMCYGWELIEVLRMLKEDDVKGVIIGDGSGIAHLKARCKEYGIEDRVLFLGRVAYDDLPAYMNLMDVCLSTQTNDLVGQVRTTGKLPIYLAAGRYILASRVGEAALILDEEMLVEYEGVKDSRYPEKLAKRISVLLKEPERLKLAAGNIALARAQFDYSVLAEKLASAVDATIQRHTKNGREQLIDKADIS